LFRLRPGGVIALVLFLHAGGIPSRRPDRREFTGFSYHHDLACPLAAVDSQLLTNSRS
jgi:hypothetical protein